MDLVNILLYCFMSCAIGAVLMLLIQYYAFVRYFNVPSVDDGDDEQQKKENEKYVLPDVRLHIIQIYVHECNIIGFILFCRTFC
jgi:hypothetical protein